MLASQTHPVQIRVTMILAAANVIGLVCLNHFKTGALQSLPSGKERIPWATKRLVYWTYMIAALNITSWMDLTYDVSEMFLCVRQSVFGFSLGLIDFYFSDVVHLPLQSLMGAALWCSSALLRTWWTQSTLGSDLTQIIPDFNISTLLIECLRFVLVVPMVGLFSDLLFSPMHRAMHMASQGPLQYASHHKKHHEYTESLTSLVIYHGTLLDDFLMPATTTVGAYLYLYLASLFGWEAYCFSNFVGQLVVFNTIFSHAHDDRCASLVVPLPDSMNFATYHRVHHLYPNCNFGLILPSDLLWDYLLGTRTILGVNYQVGKEVSQ